MLPGLRFLFAAVVLSMSMVVFGLGAAALLRASHDRFVSTPKIRSAPPPMLAQHEAATAALTMLRVDPPAPAPAAIDAATTVATAPSAPHETPPSPAETPPAAAVASVIPADAIDTIIPLPGAQDGQVQESSTEVSQPETARSDVAPATPPTPSADPLSGAGAAAPATVELIPTFSAAVFANSGETTAVPDLPTAPAAAAGQNVDPTTELAAISEALPVPPKLPVARPVIKKKPATVQRMVKKRRQTVRQPAPAAAQPFGAAAGG
uniref:Uncharacterized protein n=1 Tax=Rhodopseudomonas palustris (strain BisA53) TaxID=316055 RepID=Q07Q04_RHOP5